MMPDLPSPKTQSCYFKKPVEKKYKEGPYVINDPWSDPLYPKTIYYDDVLKAHKVIKEKIQATPMTKSNKSNDFGMNLYFKRETAHKSGSFHERGAIYSLNELTKTQRKNGVFTASMGNWAKALAYHGKKMKIPVTAYIPAIGQQNCRIFCDEYGANIIHAGGNMAESRKLAIEAMIRTTDALDCYISGYDHPHVIAAEGTIAIEILEQFPEVNAILVPIGGGGLIAGIAAVVKKLNPHILIYGIEPFRSCCFYKALDNETPYLIQNERSIGIAGWNAFHTARSLLDKVILVNDDCVARSVLHFMENERLIVEPMGALALSCLFMEPNVVPELRNKSVVCLVTGGSLDIMKFPQSLNRGKFAEGRLMTIKIAIPIGSTVEYENVLLTISRLGCDIIHHDMEHQWINPDDIGYSYLVLLCETKGLSQTASVKRIMEKLYSDRVEFYDDEYFSKA